jgi:hypothetical protein
VHVCRSGDLLPKCRGKAEFCSVLALVCGPTTLTSPDGLMEPILADFKRYGPKGVPILHKYIIAIA